MNAYSLRHWDIFCRVIDNFGDIGVSWRLARQLVDEYGVAVRLWVDQPSRLAVLCPQVDARAAQQMVYGVTIFAWHEATVFAPVGDVVIEAFGCGLPPAYLAAMAARKMPPLWIVLEYLSAEPWVRAYHGLPSPHPQLNLQRHFFFPGLTKGTGGVLREADLLPRRDAFDAAARGRWWTQQGFAAVPRETLCVSMFAYAHAPLAVLIDTWTQGEQLVVMALPDGPLAALARAHLRCASAALARAGQLELRFLPFMPQPEYDHLLWASDVNFVRGEDSFVRAQWGGHPLVWHIYPQAENAHGAKLNAFLALYGALLPDSAAAAVRGLWHAWNGMTGAPALAGAWNAFVREMPAQRHAVRRWQAQLVAAGDMASNLVKFCEQRL